MVIDLDPEAFDQTSIEGRAHPQGGSYSRDLLLTPNQDEARSIWVTYLSKLWVNRTWFLQVTQLL